MLIVFMTRIFGFGSKTPPVDRRIEQVNKKGANIFYKKCTRVFGVLESWESINVEVTWTVGQWIYYSNTGHGNLISDDFHLSS